MGSSFFLFLWEAKAGIEDRPWETRLAGPGATENVSGASENPFWGEQLGRNFPDAYRPRPTTVTEADSSAAACSTTDATASCRHTTSAADRLLRLIQPIDKAYYRPNSFRELKRTNCPSHPTIGSLRS
jgi:hypothetical protein